MDGLHTYRQVVRDVENTLRHLRDDGGIVLHDCNPAHASIACPATSYADFRAEHRWGGTSGSGDLYGAATSGRRSSTCAGSTSLRTKRNGRPPQTKGGRRRAARRGAGNPRSAAAAWPRFTRPGCRRCGLEDRWPGSRRELLAPSWHVCPTADPHEWNRSRPRAVAGR
ncbi:MAG: class I SAM-dependent methyltransferase [Mycobacterium sp.]|uniref:class I SAM-dependent methyltransferase n=1 Tax=Mycobacterium sp. TaxID=1785 RepID=UPI003C4F9D7B